MGAAPGDLRVPLGDPLGRPPHDVEPGVRRVEVALLRGQLGIGEFRLLLRAARFGVEVGTVGLGRRTRSHGVGQQTMLRIQGTGQFTRSASALVLARRRRNAQTLGKRSGRDGQSLLRARDLGLVEQHDSLAEPQARAVVLQPEATEVRDEAFGVAAEVSLHDAHDPAVRDHEDVAVVHRRDRLQCREHPIEHRVVGLVARGSPPGLEVAGPAFVDLGTGAALPLPRAALAQARLDGHVGAELPGDQLGGVMRAARDRRRRSRRPCPARARRRRPAPRRAR